MAEPPKTGTVAGKVPIPVAVATGQTYWWCACGLSKNQPFCDGSHKPTEFVPREFKATETKTLYFCACKQTAGAPLCDGTHKRI